VFYLILMVIRVHVSRSGTEMLWSCCEESDGMWWGLSGALDMDIGCGVKCTTITRAVISMIVLVSSNHAESISASSTQLRMH